VAVWEPRLALQGSVGATRLSFISLYKLINTDGCLPYCTSESADSKFFLDWYDTTFVKLAQNNMASFLSNHLESDRVSQNSQVVDFQRFTNRHFRQNPKPRKLLQMNVL